MARVAIRQAQPDLNALDVEIARLRDLDVKDLRKRWRTVFREDASRHLSRHLLFRVLAYRLQADALGDLDSGCQRLLEKSEVLAPADIKARKVLLRDMTVAIGTVLTREWNGRVYRVAVLADGFACNGKTYPSLSKVAFGITGTHWNGPRFFGLRDKRGIATQGAGP